MTVQGETQFNRVWSFRTRMKPAMGVTESSPRFASKPSPGIEKKRRCASSATAFRIARSRDDLYASYRLVYEIYLKSGFTKELDHGMRVTPYHTLSTTDVFVAEQAGRVACTMSLIGDGQLGLPVETLYPDEVARYRDGGFAIAEVGSLAQRGHNLSLLLRLINLMAQRARFRGVDELLIAVHPRHAKFYQRYLGFEMIGPLRSYRAVCGQPAVALAVNLNQLYVQDQRACSHLFGVPFSLVDLMTQPWDPAIRLETMELVEDPSGLLRPSMAS